VRQVVFVDSPGGNLWTGMRIARMLADRHVDTVAVGMRLPAASADDRAWQEPTVALACRGESCNRRANSTHLCDLQVVNGHLVGANAADKLRTSRLADLTPSSVPGARTVLTGELARLLAASAKPVIVDVTNRAEAIPGSVSVWNGGLALAS
jgi:hypothetical protein